MPTIRIGTDRGLRYPDGSVELPGSEVDHVAGPWAVADGRLLRRVEESWRTIDLGLDELVTCAVPTADGAFAGTAGAHLVEVVAGEARRVAGFEDAPTRGDWYTPWGGPPDVRSLAVAPDGALYVNVHVGGILRRDEDGWHATIDLHTDVHQVITTGGLVLAALGAGGLATSRDRGASWDRRTDGLHATYCRAVAVTGGMILLSASEGPHGGRAALYRGPLDGDGPFERCVDGLPEWFADNLDTHTLAAAGTDAVVASRAGVVFHSADAGRSWTPVADDLSPIRCVDLA